MDAPIDTPHSTCGRRPARSRTAWLAAQTSLLSLNAQSDVSLSALSVVPKIE